MFSNREFARQSLELHLFFGRIMKEHSFFLELGFTPRDVSYTEKADAFRKEFDKLLCQVIAISDGVVSQDVLNSGEVFTQYTLNAEMASSFYTDVHIPTDLTKAEMNLTGARTNSMHQRIDQIVYDINQEAIELISSLIRFKTEILTNVLSCKMFTMNYPLLIDHILREAKLYLNMVQHLQTGEEYDIENEALVQELFWNRIMAEHSKFIRGLLDPTEGDLINTANNFGNEFDQLTKEAKLAMNNTIPFEKVTADSLAATRDILNFKAQGTEGILECKVKSIIIPLLADHTVREASHYLRLLKIFSR
ncbi:DUF2935 domain-containing protein [Anaeromicropila herbilytica]|uniref:DUF2935 domain-containing protein n=1 Tax=Anaeromicropila herbilytica TaxID=2785025 RepID=A0A7R7IEZ5_9FIRM|nr:DUF2935 domain-containing protein [Anaeromicropila herbilytica]BCN31628.1 hypothetical protein bsdtb5_29230 [Anaeromicropila herbilytica]